jgi:cobalt/nickel transport system permease protein
MLLSPPQLHIPDGFLSAPVSIAGWIIAVACIGYALMKTRGQLGERQIPLMGVLAAFIFAAQALNFPVAGGTSGHLLGATLAAIIVGPWAAGLIMTCVIGLQAILFQDGGLLALGFNIVNMGILGAFTGNFVYQAARRLMGDSRASLIVSGAVGAWISVMLGAIATALQLAVSGATALNIALPAMAGVHALIGIGEALITVGALLFIGATRPDLLSAGRAAPGARSANWVGVGLALALALTLLSPLASPDPDGLNRVAEDLGFSNAAQDAPYEILPGYSVPFIQDETLTKILAVAIGTLVVFGIAFVVGRLNTRKSSA